MFLLTLGFIRCIFYKRGILFPYKSIQGGVIVGQFMGSSEASEKWGCKQATVSKLCREGKIKGAEQDGKGKPWRIPVETPNPFLKQGGQ